MHFKRIFRLFWQFFSQIVPPPLVPPSELQGGGTSAPSPLYPRLLPINIINISRLMNNYILVVQIDMYYDIMYIFIYNYILYCNRVRLLSVLEGQIRPLPSFLPGLGCGHWTPDMGAIQTPYPASTYVRIHKEHQPFPPPPP